MNNVLLLFLFASIAVANAQTDKLPGIYMLRVEAENGVIQHKMTLDEEGTFLFSSFFSPEEREGKMLQIKSMYGSGKWRNNGKEIFFIVNREEDFDEDRILDFSKTRARVQESFPEISDGESGSMQLVFFDSNISWVKGLILTRQ